jgi:hypothetical protein
VKLGKGGQIQGRHAPVERNFNIFFTISYKVKGRRVPYWIKHGKLILETTAVSTEQDYAEVLGNVEIKTGSDVLYWMLKINSAASDEF